MFFDIVGENLKKITIFVDFRTAKAAGAAQQRLTDGPLRATDKFLQNTCKPTPQCFQIWQVSAKYCTFLDFLAHC